MARYNVSIIQMANSKTKNKLLKKTTKQQNNKTTKTNKNKNNIK
jgi:hypothetical protein